MIRMSILRPGQSIPLVMVLLPKELVTVTILSRGMLMGMDWFTSICMEFLWCTSMNMSRRTLFVMLHRTRTRLVISIRSSITTWDPMESTARIVSLGSTRKVRNGIQNAYHLVGLVFGVSLVLRRQVSMIMTRTTMLTSRLWWWEHPSILRPCSTISYRERTRALPISLLQSWLPTFWVNRSMMPHWINFQIVLSSACSRGRPTDTLVRDDSSKIFITLSATTNTKSARRQMTTIPIWPASIP
mmetsp:Transcript_3763/g.10705  ORF Transcript_3763/g.10705 Transcript_3763/m.10705 type:complete len:243 (-) Transcript_3763:3744-4472(-)